MANKYVIHGATYKGDGTTSSEAVGSDVTITIASPGVVSWTAHGLAADTPVYFSTTGALPTGLTAGTKYYVRNPAADTFEVSATAGGASINTSGTQSGTHTVSGAGAWNNINIFTGTVPANGSIVAGDMIFIRTKSSAGADISVSSATALTFGTGTTTDTARTTWVFDNGVVWSGIKGVVTFTTTASVATQTFATNNNFISVDPSRLKSVHSYIHDSYISVGECLIDGLTVDWTAVTGNTGFIKTTSANLCPTIANLRLKTFKSYGTLGLVQASLENRVTLVNPVIEITSATSTGALFVTNNYTQQIIVYGGIGFGAGFNSNMSITATSGGTTGRSSGVQLIGFTYPVTARLSSAVPARSSVARCGYPYTSVACDNGLGAEIVDAWGYASSRNDGNFPTLNATLPNSTASLWSWWVQLVAGNSSSNPMTIPIAKYFTDSAAAKKVTVEILVGNTFEASLNKLNTFITVEYTSNVTGLYTIISSKSPDTSLAALETSTAAWTTTTYGAVSLVKRKLEVTTPDAIKPNTVVKIVLMSEAVGTLSSHILFVCPDPQLTTP